MPSYVVMKSLSKDKDGDSRRERKRKGQKMAFFRRTQYYNLFRKKAVTVHVENVTIKWLIDDYVIKIYFPESTTHPELGKIGDEFHVWSSKTTVTIIPDVAPKKDGTPKIEKANNGQTVYTLHIGISTRDTVSFTLKVNDFTARFNPFTMSADSLNWLFDYEEEYDDEATVIAIPYSTRIQLINLREGDIIAFPGVDNIAYEVGLVSLRSLRREGRAEVMVYDYENGLHAYHNYSVFGHPNSWFVPSVPPRSRL